MPLPPALAARLSKRGLIKSEERKKAQRVKSKDEEEEVFVEHYDDQTDDIETPNQEVNEVLEDKDDEEDDVLIHETIDCPNKINPYHECVEYCSEKWGTKSFTPILDLAKKHQRLLRKYPLPETWLEVGDPETGRFYYWNTESDKVSWLPPLHPKAQESLPQEKLRELARITQADSDSDSSSSSGSSDHSDVEEEQEMDIDDFEEIERRVLKEKRDKERRQNDRRRRQEALDPMDPASYSDIPRGTWSSGLELPGAAKTGVDSTATGPLFQQRPYPSPGAVLRMNKPKDS